MKVTDLPVRLIRADSSNCFVTLIVLVVRRSKLVDRNSAPWPHCRDTQVCSTFFCRTNSNRDMTVPSVVLKGIIISNVRFWQKKAARYLIFFSAVNPDLARVRHLGWWRLLLVCAQSAQVSPPIESFFTYPCISWTNDTSHNTTTWRWNLQDPNWKNTAGKKVNWLPIQKII